jgi:hypothetical protein
VIRILPDHLKRLLPDDPSALVAHVQAVPATSFARLGLIAPLVAGIKAVTNRCIDAAPRCAILKMRREVSGVQQKGAAKR